MSGAKGLLSINQSINQSSVIYLGGKSSMDGNADDAVTVRIWSDWSKFRKYSPF